MNTTEKVDPSFHLCLFLKFRRVELSNLSSAQVNLKQSAVDEVQ